MPLVDNLVTAILLGSAAFFVALSFGLLARYRQISQRISASSDLGKDLWQALEQRMKKQDERILDVMGRLEVIQARVLTASAAQPPVPKETPAVQQPAQPPPAPPAPKEEPANVIQHSDMQQPESQVTREKSRESQPMPAPAPSPAPLPAPQALDETHLAAIKLLGGGPKSTRQLTDALKKSREHTARMMKELFEMGLVTRNASTKPFVYQLTDEGRSKIPPA